MRTKPLILALLVGVALSGAAQATLIDRGGGLIYDTDLNITWMQDANYALTSGYQPTGGYNEWSLGAMNWYEASKFAENLSYYDSVRGVTYNDWRLPRGMKSNGYVAYGWDAKDTELGHLYYDELKNGAGQDGYTTNVGPFLNVQHGDKFWLSYYWTDALTGINPTNAYMFSFGSGGMANPPLYGFQNFADALNYYPYVWLARDGDVLTAPVPEPTTMLLLGIGLAGLAAIKLRRKKQ